MEHDINEYCRDKFEKVTELNVRMDVSEKNIKWLFGISWSAAISIIGLLITIVLKKF